AAIASSTAQQLSVPGMAIAAAGPYVNARFAAMPFTAEVIEQVRASGRSYGSSQSGRGKTVVIDYSSPNIAKPIAFHHIRSTVIGHSLARLYRSQGYRVEGINYLGDWGKQFGLVAAGFQEYGDPSRKQEMAHVVEVYVKANARAEADPAFDARAREFFRKMEEGDPSAIAIWRELQRHLERGARNLAGGLPPPLSETGHRLRALRGGELLPGADGGRDREDCENARGQGVARGAGGGHALCGGRAPGPVAKERWF